MPLSVDIKSTYGAVGDGQLVTATLSITSGQKVLTSTTPLWALGGGDIGKGISIDGAGGADDNALGLITTIVAPYIDQFSVNLALAATSTLSSVSAKVAWGTNDSPAFVAFNTAGRAATGLVSLTIPGPDIYYLGSLDQNDIHWCRGIAQLEINGQSNPTLTGLISCGTIVFPTTNQCSARTATANPGDTVIKLLTVADATRFQPGNTITQSDMLVYTAGTTAIMSSLDMQGFGDPNHFNWELVTITNVDTGTGFITISSPLRDRYLSTSPLYNAGDAGLHTDCGGPATLYMLDASWDSSIKFSGIQFFAPGGAINALARTMTFQGVTWISNLLSISRGPNLSSNDVCTLDACDFTGCSLEADKTINQMNIINGTTGHVIEFQSASIKNLFVDSTCTIDQLRGTARNSVVNGAVTTLSLGPTAYGRADSFKSTGGVFGTIAPNSVVDSIIPNANFACTNGVITVINYLPRWAIPSTWMTLQGPAESETAFTVTSGAGDGSPNVAAINTVIGTNLSGSTWPGVPLQGGTALSVMVHPAPSATFVGCTGCDDAVDLSNAGAQGKPIYSYSKRSYTAATLVNSISGPRLWGRLVSVKVTVGVAFTTSGALNLKIFGQFAAGALDPNNSNTSWNLTVDLKTTGVRTITPGLVTTTAVGSADSLGSAPGAIWFVGRQAPFISGSITGGDPGTIVIEVQTDQQFQQSKAPLGLRLAA